MNYPPIDMHITLTFEIILSNCLAYMIYTIIQIPLLNNVNTSFINALTVLELLTLRVLFRDRSEFQLRREQELH